jgi:hypothetical protein
MIRNNGYVSSSELKSVASEVRQAEKVAETSRSVNDLKSDILRLKIMVQAMMEIMIAQGIDPNLINSKMEEIIAKPETFAPSKKESAPCPECGRMVMDNGTVPLTGTCLYCGKVIRFAPKIDI